MISWDYGEVKKAQDDTSAAQEALESTQLDSPATGSEHQGTLNDKVEKITQAVSDIAQILAAMREGIDGADRAFREIDDKNKADLEAFERYFTASQQKPA